MGAWPLALPSRCWLHLSFAYKKEHSQWMLLVAFCMVVCLHAVGWLVGKGLVKHCVVVWGVHVLRRLVVSDSVGVMWCQSLRHCFCGWFRPSGPAVEFAARPLRVKDGHGGVLQVPLSYPMCRTQLVTSTAGCLRHMSMRHMFA